MHSQHAAKLIFRTYITVVWMIVLKGPFHPWNVCFWLPKERLSEGCPVRGIGDKCLLVIGHPTHLSLNIHAGGLGDFRAMQGYRIFSHQSSTVIGSQCLSREPPPEELRYSRLVRPAGNMGFSTEVLCSTSQFLLVAHSPAFGRKECVISRIVKVAFEV